MDAIVQFVRNALCCVKDLELFAGTFIHDPSYVKSTIYELPSPLDKTTPLEFAICLTQFYAFVFVSIAGYGLITKEGVNKLRRLTRVAGFVGKQTDDVTTNSIIRSSIAEEADAATRSVFVGTCVLPIGLAFFWLFANSLHITEVGWIGGLPGLILALTVMEIALVPLLYLMIKDAQANLQKSLRMKALAKNIINLKNQKENVTINLETYGWISSSDGGWKPFWTEGTSFSNKVLESAEEKMFQKEVEKLSSTIHKLQSGKDTNTYNFTEAMGKSAQDISTTILSDASVTRWEGYREYFYFVVNFIAFYGYLMAIICFLYDDDNNQPTVITAMKFQYSNSQADWTGNFSGDLMWTIEPLVILSSPIIFQYLKPNPTKTKSD